MFKVNDYIIYGNFGVCQVTDIGVREEEDNKLFYTLVPCNMAGSTILTPVDNEHVVMRAIMTKEEALEIGRAHV